MPGSGNGRQRGDVKVRCASVLAEVKQTDSETMDLKAEWFEELLRQRASYDLVFGIFFGRRGAAYIYVGPGEENVREWRTRRVSLETLPINLQLPGSTWALVTIEELRGIFDNGGS